MEPCLWPVPFKVLVTLGTGVAFSSVSLFCRHFSLCAWQAFLFAKEDTKLIIHSSQDCINETSFSPPAKQGNTLLFLVAF